MILVLDNGPCHVSKATQTALAERAAWLEVIPLARYSPHLNPKEHEWRRLKRDHRGHLAGSLREFVDVAAAGLARLGGEACAIIDAVPQWWLDGHRKEPTGRPPGRPKGAKDRKPRPPRHVFTCKYLGPRSGPPGMPGGPSQLGSIPSHPVSPCARVPARCGLVRRRRHALRDRARG